MTAPVHVVVKHLLFFWNSWSSNHKKRSICLWQCQCICLWRINYFRIAFTLNHSYKHVCHYMTTVCSIVHDRIQPQHHRKRQSTFILSVCLKAKNRIHAQDVISMALKWPPLLLCSKSLCFVLRYTGQPVFLVFQERGPKMF